MIGLSDRRRRGAEQEVADEAVAKESAIEKRLRKEEKRREEKEKWILLQSRSWISCFTAILESVTDSTHANKINLRRLMALTSF